MKRFSIFTYFSLILHFLQADSPNADQILTQVMQNMEGINYAMDISITKTQKSKPNKLREISLSVYWPQVGDIVRKSFITTRKPTNLIGVNYWEHRNHDQSKSKRWMTMPVTGKLKDVTNQKANKNEFDFSELEITAELIDSHTNSIEKTEKLKDREVIVISAFPKKKKKGYKLIWVDTKGHFVHQVEFYSKSGRLKKHIYLTDIKEINGKFIPHRIQAEDKKKKMNYDVRLSNFKFHSFQDMSIFEPKAGK